MLWLPIGRKNITEQVVLVLDLEEQELHGQSWEGGDCIPDKEHRPSKNESARPGWRIVSSGMGLSMGGWGGEGARQVFCGGPSKRPKTFKWGTCSPDYGSELPQPGPSSWWSPGSLCRFPPFALFFVQKTFPVYLLLLLPGWVQWSMGRAII